ncbi:MAG: hypothetical protein AAF488_09910 [Planctomycetota bacterium]
MTIPRGNARVALLLLATLATGCAHFARPTGDSSGAGRRSGPDSTNGVGDVDSDPRTTAERVPAPTVRGSERSGPRFSTMGRPYADLQVHTHGTVGGDFDVDVSPDGKWITYASTRHSEQPNIYLQRLERGGAIEKTRSNTRDIQPKFSPDGKWIAFASDREGNFDIWIIPVTGSAAPWHLTQSSADEIHPTWSPDGQSIAYCAREAGGEWFLWRIDVRTQKRTQIGPGLYPEWSPDGKSLAFQRPSERGAGWYGVWIVAIDGGAPEEMVTEENWGTIQPAWSPNSKSLVYGTARAPIDRPDAPPRADDLWVVSRDGRRYQLTTAAGSDYAPAWGLDGRIYFTSHRGGSPRIVSLKPGSIQPPLGPVPTSGSTAKTFDGEDMNR